MTERTRARLMPRRTVGALDPAGLPTGLGLGQPETGGIGVGKARWSRARTSIVIGFSKRRNANILAPALDFPKIASMPCVVAAPPGRSTAGEARPPAGDTSHGP